MDRTPVPTSTGRPSTLPTASCPNAHQNIDCEHCLVRSLSVCAALKSEEMVAFQAVSRASCYAGRDNLFDQDEPAESVHIVTSGMVRLFKLLPDGRRQIVGFAIPGDFLGLSMNDTNAFSADALNAVTTCQFSRKVFANLLDEKPHLLRRLYSEACHELTLAQDQMTILGRRTAEEKVVSFLLTLRDRLLRAKGSAVHLELPMTRQDIGDYLGLTIETVSRMFSKLAREKSIVVVPDGIRFLNSSKLEALAER